MKHLKYKIRYKYEVSVIYKLARKLSLLETLPSGDPLGRKMGSILWVHWNGFTYGIRETNRGISLFNVSLKKHGFLIKCEVKMTGYWRSSFFRVYGPRRTRSPSTRKK